MPKEKAKVTRIPAAHLRRLRNEIPIVELVRAPLDWPTKVQEGYLRFLCPLCHDFHTATNPKTNLARCFRCRTNFNPIDLVMTVKKYSFLEAVAFLEKFL